MEITAQPTWLLDLDRHASSTLSRVSDRNIVGNKEVLIAPAFENIPDSQIIDELDGMLDRYDINDELRALEESNKTKLGPRSIQKNWEERRDSLVEYYSHQVTTPEYLIPPSVKPPEFASRLRPLSFHEAQGTLIGSSNSGLPSLIRKKGLLPLTEDVVNEQQGKYPCVLFTRTQEGNKTRNVWGYPLADLMRELPYLQAFLPIEKKLSWRSALRGPNDVDKEVTQVLEMARRMDREVISIDFSSYDASVTPELSNKAFGYIASAFGDVYHDELFEIWHRFATIPIHTPEGDFGGPHGVPSGSGFTNTIDSFAQYEAFHNSDRGGSELMQVQGDDGLYLTNDKEELYGRFSKEGLTVNTDKSHESSDSAIYLQRYYNNAYLSRDIPGQLGGVYPIHRAINRLKYLERWTDLDKANINGKDYFALRAVMILENVKHHPAFEEFVKLVQSWDKFNLEFNTDAVPAFSRLMESKTRAGVNNEDILTGLHKYESIQVLMS